MYVINISVIHKTETGEDKDLFEPQEIGDFDKQLHMYENQLKNELQTIKLKRNSTTAFKPRVVTCNFIDFNTEPGHNPADVFDSLDSYLQSQFSEIEADVFAFQKRADKSISFKDYIYDLRHEFLSNKNNNLLILIISAHGCFTEKGDVFIIFDDFKPNPETRQQYRGVKELININQDVVDVLSADFDSNGKWKNKRMILFFDCCRSPKTMKDLVQNFPGYQGLRGVRSSFIGNY